MNFTRLSGLVAAAFVAAMWMVPAQAQATRTWVSGVGDDVNPCSRTAPCKTFPGAISKTAAGGEIDVLDPGGFGAVTITKSITIDGSGGSIAGVLVSGTNGMTVNDSGSGTPGTAVVTIRNIDLEGIGFSTGTAGVRGISFVSGAVLNVQHCVIRNFRDPSNGTGISFTPSGAATLNVDDTILTGNGNASAGGGIVVQPTGASGAARVVLTNVRVENNSNNGLSVNSTGNTSAGGTILTAIDSTFSGNTAGVTVVAPASTAPATVMLNHVVIANNTSLGLIGNGTNLAHVRIGFSTITGNGTGVLAAGTSLVDSYGNNLLDGNITSNGTFSTGATPLPLH